MPGGLGNWLIGAGILLVLVGVIVKTGVVSWFGSLPGDIHVKRDSYQVFIPITSMILISLVLSAVVALVRRFF